MEIGVELLAITKARAAEGQLIREQQPHLSAATDMQILKPSQDMNFKLICDQHLGERGRACTCPLLFLVVVNFVSVKVQDKL